MLSRWSVAAAVFGGACNLLFVILTMYQDESLQHIRPNEWRSIIGVTAINVGAVIGFARFPPLPRGYPHLLCSFRFWFGE